MNRFENGFDSFKKSIMCLTKNSIDEVDLKEIIINFHHSIEVLFKHILFNKQSLFIYNDIDKIIERSFNMKLGIGKNKEEKNVEPFTITFDDSIKRITVICEETIDEYTYNRLKNLNKFRNSLTHDELDLIKEKVEQLIISILPTVIMILQKHLPEENKKEFIDFIDEKEIETKLSDLYIYNDKWKIITITNLLTTYKSIDYGKISMSDKRHIRKMISLLGCEIDEDDMFTIIDEKYYLSAISYLKQEICEQIVKGMDEYIEDDEINELLSKNEIIADVCKEYIENMTKRLIDLMDIDKDKLLILTHDEKELNSYFDNVLLINKLDIYKILSYIGNMVESYVNTCNSKKRRADFLKEIILYDDKELNAFNIYSCLIRWFKKATWYNKLNFKEVCEEAINVFIEGNYLSSEFEEEVSNYLYENELFDDLIGDFGKYRSIDRIDQHYIEDIDIIIKDVNNSTEYTLILDVSVSVETYIEHDYYDNGTESTYVAVNGQITEDNKFSINNIEYLGKKISFHNLGFE